MADWQKGDLALCVDTSRIFHRRRFVILVATHLRKGAVYAVEAAFCDSDGDDVLVLDGVRNTALAARFRKVTPPKADQFDREVIDLMAGKKVPA